MTRTLIVGGSIGGLAAAIALDALGHDVTVAERRTSFEDGGAGILFDPMVINAIRALVPGKSADFPVSIATRRREMSVGSAGEVQSDNFYPGQTRTAAWADLRRFLRDLAPDKVVNHDIQKLVIAEEDITAPELGTFDVVILADGYHSAHRHLVSSKDDPSYNRSVLWRGLFKLDDSVPGNVSSFFDDAFSVVSGFPDHFVGYTIRAQDGDGLLANWGWYVEADFDQLSNWFTGSDGSFNARSVSPDKVSEAVRREIAERAVATWPSPVRDVIQHTVDAQRLFAAGIFNYRPTALARGRIAIVGDAGHTAVPITGAGAKHAMLDALALHRSFSQYDEPLKALAHYEATRLDEVQQLVDFGERWAQRFQRITASNSSFGS